MLKRLILFLFGVLIFNSSFSQAEIYELRVYELDLRPPEVLYTYLEKALIPALNRQGVERVGAFEEAGAAMPKKLYLIIPYDNMESVVKVTDGYRADQEYLTSAKPYFDAPEDQIAYTSYKSSFIRSASGFPVLVKPPDDFELFELRIYESYNEDALRRKVKMFNDSEFEIFQEVNLPMVFFGENISGGQLPCLTYLLAFKDEDHLAEAWSKFGSHPEWQRIFKLEEYANTVNDITRVFLKPLPYSQL